MKFYRFKSTINRILNPKKELNWLGTIAITLSIWFLIIRFPYNIIYSILLFIPFLGLILNWFLVKKSLIYSYRPSIYTLVYITGREDGDNTYQIADYITFPAITMFLRSMIDYVYYITNIKLALATCLIIFITIIILITISYRIIFYIPTKRKRVYSEFFIIILFLSAGITLGVNCNYDNSTPIIKPSIIIKKYVDFEGKRRCTPSYYVEITIISNIKDTSHIKISRQYYKKIKPGDTVNLQVKKGLLNIPWNYID